VKFAIAARSASADVVAAIAAKAAVCRLLASDRLMVSIVHICPFETLLLGVKSAPEPLSSSCSQLC